MAITIDIANAVASELAQGSFSMPFTPEHRVLPGYELSELKTLRVTVVPAGVQMRGATRSLCEHDVQIDIGIQKKLAGEDGSLESEVSQLCTLVESIHDFLKRRVLGGMPNAVWVRSSNDPIYAVDHLAQQRTFTSVLSVTYRVLA